MASQPAERIPFEPEVAFPKIEAAIAPYPKAMLFQLAEEGHDSAFEQLVACIISIRTYDEVSYGVAKRLFEAAPTPAAMVNLSIEEIDEMISGSTFHGAKAPQLHAIARQVVEEFDGVLPCDLETLLAMKGVGPKCAHLALGIACGEPFIGVDIHVHRVTNRWGYVEAKTPEKSLVQLEKKLPREYWIDINRLLVPFGKHICTGNLPRCSTCPVWEMCQQVGVEKHR
ncbi:endonuclease III [bacterium]|nr:MAG: endonuclease III [bacterium]